MYLDEPPLYFDVDHVGHGMMRIENDYFPCANDELLVHPDGTITASIPLENGAHFVLLVSHSHSRVWCWDDGLWTRIEGGRIIRAPEFTPEHDWNENITSTDDLKALMRQVGAMEASQYRPDQARSAPGELQGAAGMDLDLAELLA